MHIAFYSKAVKISSKPFLSLASADRDESRQTLATRRGVDDPACDCSDAAHSSSPERNGAQTPRKAGAFPAQPRGWMCSRQGRAVCEARKDELCHHLCPSCCFSNEGSALGHRRVPKSVPRQGCSTADIPPSRGTAQAGFKYDFVSGEGRSRRSLGGMAQARYCFGCPTPQHSPTTGLQFGMEAPAAIEWGQGIKARRAPAWLGAPQVEQAGKPAQGEQLALQEAQPHPSARPRMAAAPGEPLAGSQPSAEGLTSCESRPS